MVTISYQQLFYSSYQQAQNENVYGQIKLHKLSGSIHGDYCLIIWKPSEKE